MIFFTLLLIPTLIAVCTFIFGGKQVTVKELLMQMGVQLLIVGIAVACIYHRNISDTELWHGRVAEKKKETVSCRHGYPCNCHEICSGSGKDRSCYTHCDTCYEHTWDYDWMVYTTNRESIEIDKIDSQGVQEPPRWTQVKIQEPTAVTHSCINYIKAAPDSLFRHSGLVQKFQSSIPTYPLNVYDYYKVDRVVSEVALPDMANWNQALMELNADLGAKKEVSAALVILKDKPHDFFYALEQAWTGGKRNDSILVVNLSGDTITWVDVMAWTRDPLFKVKLRDDVLALGSLDRDQIMQVYQKDIVTFHQRKRMEEFEYLKASVVPTKGEFIFVLILGVIVALGLSYFVFNEDVFNENMSHW